MRQGKFNARGAIRVPGEGRHDRTHLLMTRRQQENRRTDVAFDASGEKPRIRMGKLTRAMWPHRAATAQVWIDQGANDTGALQPGIKPRPDFGQVGRVGPEPGRHDNLIHEDRRKRSCMITG